MSGRLRAPKGTHDLLPPDSERFAAVEATARRVFSSYGYGEIRTPTFESTELFARSVGETTDIVHKEMYTFPDRKGRSLTLRPENTAGVVRALVEAGIQEAPRPIRLWYAGSQFRYEQPQAGRYREFRQIGVELLGVASAAGDAEVLIMLFAFLGELGFRDLVATLNCIPRGEARAAFSRALQEHVRPRAAALGAEDRRRLEENPLRLYDSKDPDAAKILEGAPATLDFLDEGRARPPPAAAGAPLARRASASSRAPRSCAASTTTRCTVFEVASERLGAQNAILRRRPLRRAGRGARRPADSRPSGSRSARTVSSRRWRPTPRAARRVLRDSRLAGGGRVRARRLRRDPRAGPRRRSSRWT